MLRFQPGAMITQPGAKLFCEKRTDCGMQIVTASYGKTLLRQAFGNHSSARPADCPATARDRLNSCAAQLAIAAFHWPIRSSLTGVGNVLACLFSN